MTSNARYHTLDAMRGVAAIAVVFYHMQDRLKGTSENGGYLAVDFFFALSGFVIALAYNNRLEGGLSVRRFLETRLVRLYPLFFLGSLFGLAKQIFQMIERDPHAQKFSRFLAVAVFNLLMLPAPLPLDSLFPLNGPAWSLFLELFINIIYAAVLFRLAARVLVWLCLACAVIVTIGDVQYSGLNLGWGWSTFIFGLGRVGFSFSLGVLFARWHRPSSRHKSLFSVWIVLLIPTLLLIDADSEVRTFLDPLAAFVVLPTLLWLGTRLELPDLAQPAAAFLGDISYPLYAIHFPLLTFYIYLQQHALHLTTPAFYISFLVIAGASALLAGRFYDAPLRGRISTLSGLNRSARPQIIGPSG